MQIIIVGDGKVGVALTEQLSSEGHDITVIDSNPKVLEQSLESYDVMVVHGNGASIGVLKEAGVEDAHLLIAATSRDETNLLTCIVAKKLGAKHTIARVRNPEYAEQLVLMRDELGLSMTINPELEAAKEMTRLLNFPTAIDIFSFAKDRIDMLRFRVPQRSMLIGISLKQLAQLTTNNLLICIIERNSEIIVPNGDTVIMSGDILTIMAMPSDVEEFFRKIGVKTNKAENVMIVGGGATSYYLAKLLSSRNIHVTIIEKDMKRCEELVDALPDVTVDCGDGTDRQLLDEEHLENMDGFVACTGIDEVNAILSLYVMNRVKKKVVTKLNHVDFGELLDNLHLDSVINPKEITAQKIVQYVRAAGNSMESNVETLYRLMNGRVEAMEFFIDKDSLVTGQKLVDMKIKDGVIIAGILRGGRLIIPGGQDEFRIGDTVIVVTTHIGFHDIYNILK